jgi:acyl-CoA thioester hydrolase
LSRVDTQRRRAAKAPGAPPGRLAHSCRLPIRWGDMDAYGHVNNTVYFLYMQEARVDYLESLGYRIGDYDTTPVIITAACTFLIPIAYPGEVEVRLFLGEPGRSSILSSYEMRRGDSDALCATGEATIVWTEVASGRPVPIPENLRERFERG